MKKILLSVSLLSVLFFNGCGHIDPEPKIIYIKNKYPKHRYLYKIKPFEITDIFVLNKRYYGVNKKQLKHASNTSKLLRKQNEFYRNQVIEYNRKFVETSTDTKTDKK